jgi:hypothetical protein
MEIYNEKIRKKELQRLRDKKYSKIEKCNI